MDIIGNKYRMLTVIAKAEPFILPSGQKNSAVLCRCECGKEKVCRTLHLIRNKITSCGCVKIYYGQLRKSGDNKNIRKLWRAIKYRCQENYIDRHVYFDRGITVCDEWLQNYHLFEDWCIKNNYSKELQIDRIDNYKGYSPDNCRFVTPKVNGRNKRNSFNVEYKGEIINLRDLLDKIESNLRFETVYRRICKYGWSVEDAIESPIVKSGHNRYGKCTRSVINN